MGWTEHVPGVLWTQPVGDDSIGVKIAELGLVAKSNEIIAFKDFRLALAQGGDGALSLVVADAQDNMSQFQGRPV